MKKKGVTKTGKKDRKASRPSDVVFSDQMDRAYQTYLNLIGKVKRLSQHRAIRHDENGKLGGTFNRFLERVTEEITACKVKPGQVAQAAEEPTLSEFLAPSD